MQRLTLIRINRAFRQHRIPAMLMKDAPSLYVLKVAGREGDEMRRYGMIRRVNRLSLDAWIDLAKAGVEWAREKDGGIKVARPAEGGMAAILDEWAKANMPELVQQEIVNVRTHERARIQLPNGPNLKRRAQEYMESVYGAEWRFSRNGPVHKQEDGNEAPFRLPAEVREPEPDLTLEDAVALAHLVAEDLADGRLDGDKVKTVQELVGGRVRQSNGSYKYVLLVGRWAIKVDKGRKPGDKYYVGSAGEALIIEHLKQQHAHLARHFPQTAVVNYFTSVQERADVDAGRYSAHEKEIARIAKTVQIGDYHSQNVGFRPNDNTPVFIDVARGEDAYTPRYHHFNKLFYAQYELYEAQRELKEYEEQISSKRALVAERTQLVNNLQAGA